MKDTFNGLVVVRKINAGSKSEKDAALLVQENGQSLQLLLAGDRHFTNLDAFGQYAGKKVSVTGERDGGTVVVKSKADIRLLP